MRVSWFPDEEEALLTLFLEARNNPVFYTGKQIRAEGWEWIYQEMTTSHCVDNKPKSAMQFKVQQLMREYEYFDYLCTLDGAQVVGEGKIQLDDAIWNQVMHAKPTQIKFFRKIRSCGIRHVELCSLIGKRGRIHTNTGANGIPQAMPEAVPVAMPVPAQKPKKASKPSAKKAKNTKKPIKKRVVVSDDEEVRHEPMVGEEEEVQLEIDTTTAPSVVVNMQDEDVENHPTDNLLLPGGVAQSSPVVSSRNVCWSAPMSPSTCSSGISSPSLPSSPSSCSSVALSPSSNSSMSSPETTPRSQRPSKTRRIARLDGDPMDAQLNEQEAVQEAAQNLHVLNPTMLAKLLNCTMQKETEKNLNKFLVVATKFMQRKLSKHSHRHDHQANQWS